MNKEIGYNSNLLRRRWIAYFDLLGIKQLNEKEDYISIFVALQTAIKELKEKATAWDEIRHIWFSDTFIAYTKDDSYQSFDAINNIAYWFSYFLIWYNVPLRGAISCDKLYADIENNLFFGKALIEAYEYGES